MARERGYQSYNDERRYKDVETYAHNSGPFSRLPQSYQNHAMAALYNKGFGVQVGRKMTESEKEARALFLSVLSGQARKAFWTRWNEYYKSRKG